MEIFMEMLGKIHNEKRHEQVGEGHFKRQRQRERQPYRRGGGGWWWRWVRVRASSSTGADVMGKP